LDPGIGVDFLEKNTVSYIAGSLTTVHRLSSLQPSQYLTSKYRLPELAAKEKNENNFR